MQAAGYVSAARRDPDGAAVRMALGRKVTVNTMAAGEKFFVDLLPENWSGLPPGLPQEVVDDLARRAREAEKAARTQQQAKKQRTLPAVRVRVGTQPTFTRYTSAADADFGADRTPGEQAQPGRSRRPLRFDPPTSRRRCRRSSRRSMRSRAKIRIASAFRFRRQGRRPHLPRREQLRARRAAAARACRRSDRSGRERRGDRGATAPAASAPRVRRPKSRSRSSQPLRRSPSSWQSAPKPPTLAEAPGSRSRQPNRPSLRSPPRSRGPRRSPNHRM